MAEEPELKVVDRRSQSAEAEKTSSSEAKVSKPGSAANQPPTDDSTEMDDDSRPMDFASFIVGLATQAMMLLGEIPEPQSGRMLPPNLSAARQTIDIISLLQEKTTGNLTDDESKLIQDVLTSLRIAFVKRAKQ